jgi:hypothetical protein
VAIRPRVARGRATFAVALMRRVPSRGSLPRG